MPKVVVGEMLPAGYKIHNVPRQDRIGGGVALVMKDSVQHVAKPVRDDLSFEYLNVDIKLANNHLNVLVINSPQAKSYNCRDSTVFLNSSLFLL